MESKVSAYIHAHDLLSREGEVLVALSGGPDSVALLLVLSELGYSLCALHCNFHLRGEESDRDECFVRQFCQRLDIPLLVEHFDTIDYASEHKLSIEMAARELRYTWFDDVLQQRRAQCIAVGHHRDDEVETLLINLIRGTGLRGLCGIPAVRDSVVRPLLCVSRQEILDYLARQQQSYVTDSTNAERIALRNRIRLDVLPLLRTLNPRIDEKLSETCEHMRSVRAFLDEKVSEAFLRHGITTQYFPHSSEESETPLLLHEWLRDKGFNLSQEREILSALPLEGSRSWLSATHRIVQSAHTLTLYPLTQEDSLPVLHEQVIDRPSSWDRDKAYFDADLLSEPLSIRPVAEADRMRPFGMKGSKLLSDLMRELRLDIAQRERQYVVCHGSDILWLVGHRASDLYKVTPETRRVLCLSVSYSPSNETELTNVPEP